MITTFLENLPDKRRKQGQMYDLKHLLLFSILAILSGATSYRKVETFIGLRFKLLKEKFKIKWKKAPEYSTIRRAIHGLEADDLEEAFRKYSKALTQTPLKKGKDEGGDEEDEKDIQCISMDGKVVRGSFDQFEDQKAIQVLSAFLLGKDIILAHEEIDRKTNEIPVAQKLIEALGLKDFIFIFDALHCQKKLWKSARKPGIRL